MEELLSYLKMIDTRLLHCIKGKPEKMIKLLRENDFDSEEDLIVALLGKGGSRDKYYLLKSRTIKLLQALAIVTDTNSGSIVKRKNDLCQKNFTIAQKFLKKGLRKEGIKLVKQAYGIAVAYDFVYLACEFSSILHHNHMLYEPNTRMANLYAAQTEKYLHEYMAEKRAEYYFLQATIRKNKAKKVQNLEDAIANIAALKGTSVICLFYRFSLEVLHSFSLADYPSVIKSCDGMLKVLEGKKGAYAAHYQFCLTKSWFAHMAIGEYEQASEKLKRAEKYVPARSYNDYLLKLHQTINALHSKDYQLAYDLYRKHKKCSFESIRQQFAIIEAYICFLSHMGYLELSHTFRLGKYLNDTIVSQSNKQKENIAILIAELLIYFVRDRGKYADRVEAIKNYSYRHLKGKETARAKHMIKILCRLPDLNFHPEALKRHMKKHIEFIQNSAVQIGEDIALIEFIPFEKLLAMILERLERRR